MATEIALEATTETEDAQDVIVVDTGPNIESRTTQGRQHSPAATKREDEVMVSDLDDSLFSRRHTGLGDNHQEITEESVKPHTTEPTRSPTSCQKLIARIRNAEVSNLGSHNVVFVCCRTDTDG